MRERIVVSVFACLLLVAALLPPAHGQQPQAETLQQLYAKAKPEGQVVFWASGPAMVDWIQDEFAKRFPGIEVKWTADLDTPTKLIAEYRAGRHTVDLFTFSIGGMLPLHERGMLAAVDWKALGVPPESVFLDGRAAAVLNLVNTVIFNTRLVRREEAPKSWEELLDPKWRGKIGANQVLLPRSLAFLGLVWGEEKTAQYARDLREKAQVLLTRSPTEGLLGSGERPIIVGEFVSSAMQWSAKGVPADWLPLNPTGAVQFALAVLDKAPHPNAARLLAAWLLTDEAKELREKQRFHADVRPGTRTALGRSQHAAHPQLVYEDAATVKRRVELYNKLAPIVQGAAR
jgi:iron(III) transport system substrate-binding protein